MSIRRLLWFGGGDSLLGRRASGDRSGSWRQFRHQAGEHSRDVRHRVRLRCRHARRPCVHRPRRHPEGRLAHRRARDHDLRGVDRRRLAGRRRPYLLESRSSPRCLLGTVRARDVGGRSLLRSYSRH